MNELLCEESFQMLPECEFLAYSLSRDYFKNPITGEELIQLKNIIRIKRNEKQRLGRLAKLKKAKVKSMESNMKPEKLSLILIKENLIQVYKQIWHS